MLKSKKFVALIAGLASEFVVLLLTLFAGLPEEQALTFGKYVAQLIGAYAIGQGVADGLSKGATSGVANGGAKK